MASDNLPRRDRIARGSDHMSFAAEGFPAICLREMHEHYDTSVPPAG